VRTYAFQAFTNGALLATQAVALANRTVRGTSEGPFTTACTYNGHLDVSSVTRPEGDQTLYAYDESSPFTSGNVLSVTRIPDTKRA
jgi:hypothetical protein